MEKGAMRNSRFSILIAAALVLQTVSGFSQDPYKTYASLRSSRDAIERMQLLTRIYPKDDPRGKQISADLASVTKEILAVEKQLAKIEADIHTDFKASFAKLKTVKDVSWIAGRNYKPLLDKLSDEFKLEKNGDGILHP
jgi:hypothetical protein